MSNEAEATEPSAIPAVQEETTSQEVEATEVATEEAQTPEASSDAEASSGETETTETDEPEKKKNSFQERISELNRQKKEAQQRAEEMERRARSLEERLASSAQQDEQPYPTLEAYGYDEDAYQKALVDYTTSKSQRAYQQARLEEEQALLQEARTKQQQYMLQTFTERANTFAETQPDFTAKLNDPTFAATFKQSPSVQEAVLTSDNGPAMAYYLASNPHVTQELATLSPVMAGMRLAGIESKLAAPVSVKPTNTPEPIKPVTPSGKVEKDPSDMTPKEYVAYRRKQGR